MPGSKLRHWPPATIQNTGRGAFFLSEGLSMWRTELESDSFTQSIRYALLALFFCAVTVVELVHAKFSLLTLTELHAYWLGKNGQFPFTVLPWSEQHFGGDALAMRLPLLLIFAVLLAVLLLGLNRLLRTFGPITLLSVTLVLLVGLAVQQYFSLQAVRRERHKFFALIDRLERAAAPGEPVLAEWNLAIPLYTYASDSIRTQLRSSAHSFPDVPPVAFYSGDEPHEEMIYVGSLQDALAQSKFVREGFQFREDVPAFADAASDVARYYRAAGASIYFVSPTPPSPDALTRSTAVSSKP